MPKLHTVESRKDPNAHMTPYQEELEAFVLWKATPKVARVPQYRKDLAKQFGIADQTLRNWELDPRIMSRISAKVLTGLTVDDLPDIVYTLKVIATDPDHRSCVSAAKQVLELMEKTSGASAPVPMAELSNEELKQMAADIYDAVDERTETA